jgi:competence protein ComEC
MPKSSLAILDVGHGNSAVIIDTGGVVVIDTGSRAGLINYLEEEGIEKVDVVLLSHADADHIGGFIGLLSSDKFDLGHVRVNGDAIKATETWESLRYELDHSQRAGEISYEPILVEDSSGQFDRGEVHIAILGPSRFLVSGKKDSRGHTVVSNSKSAVIHLSRRGHPLALLPGDLDEIGLTELVRINASMEAPILVFPHHGGSNYKADEPGFAIRLCELVKPKIVVFSIGRGRHSTPREEIVRAIREWNSSVKVMCTQLSEHCCAAAPVEEPKHLAKVFSAGRQHRACCAGSILISLDDDNPIVMPDVKSHDAFIQVNAKTALCQKQY